MMKKTAYEWCFELNIRPLDMTDNDANTFCRDNMDINEFKTFISRFTVKPNSMPRKPADFLELRMYGFVPYNISEIQKGIQFGHAVVEYGMKYMNTVEYQNFANLWKTFIILNGGTSNDGNTVKHGHSFIKYTGTMNTILESLFDNDINCAFFREPDMNNMLTAAVFLVDERVFNKELYPDFIGQPLLEEEENAKNYSAWVEKIGGQKNAFLRTLLDGKRLA